MPILTMGDVDMILSCTKHMFTALYIGMCIITLIAAVDCGGGVYVYPTDYEKQEQPIKLQVTENAHWGGDPGHGIHNQEIGQVPVDNYILKFTYENGFHNYFLQ